MKLTNTLRILCVLLSFFALHSSFAQNVPSYVPTNGLVGWWPFNGNANDESGNGNNGTINGATLASDRFMNSNSSFYIDGINCPSAKGVSLQSPLNNAAEYSISMWFKSADLTKENQVYFNSSPHQYIGASYNYLGRGPVTSLGVGNGTWANAGATGNIVWNTPNGGDWNNIIIVKTVQSFTAYENGNQVYQYLISPNFNSGTINQIVIGASSINGGINCYEVFKGWVDDVAIYNRALTQQEITNLYNASLPAPFPTLPSNLQAGLVGYWPFNGNANDESGNGNNGTVNGATLTLDRFGDSGRAYSFDGVNDFIWAGLVSPLNGATKTTISYWMNSPLNFPANPAGNYGTAIGHWKHDGQFNGPTGIQISHNSDGSVNASFSGVQGGSSTTNVVEENGWLVFSLIFDGTKPDSQRVACYINGLFKEYIKVPNAPSAIGVQATRTYFGAACGPNNIPLYALSFFNGKLDDICIWNRALDPTEIAQLYQTQSTPSEDGKIGVNIASPQRSLHIKDVIRLEPRNTAPDNPVRGDMYYDGIMNKLRVYDGTSWQNCW